MLDILRFMSAVRYVIALSPSCLRRIGAIPFGLKALDVLEVPIAVVTCSVVKHITSESDSLRRFLIVARQSLSLVRG